MPALLLRTVRFTALVGALLVAVACEGRAPVEARELPLSIDGLGERLRASFRREGCGHVTGRETWRAHVSSTGEVTLRAWSPPTASPAGEACEQVPSAVESGALRLLTKEVGSWRGEASVAKEGAEGELWIDRGGARERLRNTPAGLEQTWHFASRPETDGDLLVRVAVDGLAHVASSEEGHHFADAAGRGFRYGRATWVDAAGLRADVPVTWSEGALHLRVPGGVLARSSYPAVLDPVLYAEFALEPISSMLVAERFETVKLAPHPGNGGFIAAWAHVEAGGVQVRVARVQEQNGLLSVLDPGGIDVYGFTGTEFLLEDLAVSGSTVAVASRVFNGTAYPANVRSVPFPPATAFTMHNKSADTGTVFLAELGGGEFAVALTDVVNGRPQARFRNFPASSTFVAPSNGTQPERVTGLACGTFCVALVEVGTAPNVTLDLLVWDKSSTLVDRFPIGGALPGVGNGTLRGGTLSSAFHGGDQRVFGTYLLDEAGGTSLRGFTFEPIWPIDTASIFTPLGVPISDGMAAVGAFHGEPSVTTDGNVHSVVWRCGEQLCRRTYDAEGFPQGAAKRLTLTGKWQRPDATHFANGLAVAAEEKGGTRTAIKAAVFDSNGQGTPWTRLVSPLLSQLRPRAAYDGQAFHVVWDEESGGEHRAVTLRLSPSGAPLEAAPIALGDASNTPARPSVASCDGGTLAVWTDEDPAPGDRRVWGLFTSAGAAPNPQNAFAIAASEPQAKDVAVGCLGTGQRFLVTWLRRSGTNPWEVEARLVMPPNLVSALPASMPVAGASAEGLSVAGGHSGAVMVWGEDQQVLGAFVDASGQPGPLGPSGSAVPTLLGSGRVSEPALGYNGQSWLVAWGQTGGFGTEIHGREISAAQQPGPAGKLVTGADVTDPRLSWTGSEWAVINVDSALPATQDVMFRRLSGSPPAEVPGSVYPVTTTPSRETDPEIASTDQGALLLLYSRQLPVGTLDAAQVFGAMSGDHDGGTDGGEEPDAGTEVDAGSDAGTPKDAGEEPDAGEWDAGADAGSDAGESRVLTLTATARSLTGELSPGSAVRVTLFARDAMASRHGPVHLSFSGERLALADEALASQGQVLTPAELERGVTVEVRAALAGAPGEAARLSVVAREGDASGEELARADSERLVIGEHEVTVGCGGCAQGAGTGATAVWAVLLFAALATRGRMRSSVKS